MAIIATALQSIHAHSDQQLQNKGVVLSFTVMKLPPKSAKHRVRKERSFCYIEAEVGALLINCLPTDVENYFSEKLIVREAYI